MRIKDIYYLLLVNLRERTNPLLGPIRRKGLNENGFTIISNNCWAGHVYRWFSMEYNSPTIGLYMFSEDYIKFIWNLRHYLEANPQFINYKDSKYRDILAARGGDNISCPIARFDDIEVVFLHYKTEEEALKKWNRRKQRINWDNLFFKMSEQNECSLEHLKAFDSLPTKNKFVFVHKDYGLNSQIIFKDFCHADYVANDTTRFSNV